MRLHARVAEAADLGAEDGVIAGGGGGEVDVHLHAGDGVLLDPHAGDKEAVDDVNAADAEVGFVSGREGEDTGYDVVGAMGVGGVEAERVSSRGADELRACPAKGVVWAGIAEVPLELLAGDFYLQGVRRGALITDSSPELLGADGHPCVEDGEGDEREIFPAHGREIVSGALSAYEGDEEEDVGEHE